MLILASSTVNACRNGRVEKPKELNQPLPAFLSFVAPAPESVYSVEAYNQGEHYPQQVHPAPEDAKHRVCTEIFARPLLEPGDFFALYSSEGEVFSDRVSAYVDGEAAEKDEKIYTILGTSPIIDEDGKVIADAPGPDIICWIAPLKPGEHWAMIEVEKTSGVRVRYSWSFTLTD
jgi:hypothetical protein